MSTTRSKLQLGYSLFVLAIVAAGCGPSYPKCDNDEDCKEKEFCVNGMCQQCRNDSDCGTGNRCLAGRCEAIPGYCGSSSDCPQGQECKDNRCIVTSSEDLEQPVSSDGCSIEPVYFAFDSSELPADVRDRVQRNVECMKELKIENLHLTGHADPRGTEEYNLALGDRRARSVREYMVSLGISEKNLSVSSMGEEMSRGTEEASWGKDRRVDMKQK